MELNSERLRRFFERLKTIGLLQRIFGWNSVRQELIDVNGDIQRLILMNEQLRNENTKIESQLSIERASSKNLQETHARVVAEASALAKTNEERLKENTRLGENNNSYLKRGQELSNDNAVLRQRIENLEVEINRLKNDNFQLQKGEEVVKQELVKAIASLRQVQDGVRKEREEEKTVKQNTEIERIRSLKETWSRHENNVRMRIRNIAVRHMIEYVERVPFRGNPDNTIKINGEFVVFDAKSPAGEDLSNFNNYLKAQAESAIKYVKEANVKREIFLVVPTNTLEVINRYEYRLADYTVYIVSVDSLEPVILTLQKIEQYEFADQLSPEERENICRVIGKFLHLSKRRIQIDGFFAKQFFEMVYRSEAELPADILQKVQEFERSEKLNPPTEKRAKQINLRELEVDSDKLKSEANQKGIVTEDSILTRELNKLPLYIPDSQNSDQPNLFGE